MAQRGLDQFLKKEAPASSPQDERLAKELKAKVESLQAAKKVIKERDDGYSMSGTVAQPFEVDPYNLSVIQTLENRIQALSQKVSVIRSGGTYQATLADLESLKDRLIIAQEHMKQQDDVVKRSHMAQIIQQRQEYERNIPRLKTEYEMLLQQHEQLLLQAAQLRI